MLWLKPIINPVVFSNGKSTSAVQESTYLLYSLQSNINEYCQTIEELADYQWLQGATAVCQITGYFLFLKNTMLKKNVFRKDSLIR